MKAGASGSFVLACRRIINVLGEHLVQTSAHDFIHSKVAQDVTGVIYLVFSCSCFVTHAHYDYEQSAVHGLCCVGVTVWCVGVLCWTAVVLVCQMTSRDLQVSVPKFSRH